jgi:hypothetical protein
MAEVCAGCGETFDTGTVCPQCGRPAQVGAAIPPPAAMHVRTAVTIPRAVLAAGITFVALAVIAGGAYAAVRLLAPTLPSGAGGNSAGLVVTGTAPTPSTWAGGVSQKWRLYPEKVARAAGLEDPYGGTYGGRTKDRIGFATDTATASGSVLGIDVATGAVKWTAGTQESCFGMLADGRLRCQGGRMGYYPTDLTNLSNGDRSEVASSQELGTGIPDGEEDRYSWTTAVLGGALYGYWTDGNQQTSQISLGRIADDGKSFVWKANFPVEGIDSGLLWFGGAADGRVQHDIVTIANAAVDSDSGTVLLARQGSEPGSRVQWVAQNVLQGGVASSAPHLIEAPDHAQIANIGIGGITVTTQALPRFPLRQTLHGVGAFDPSVTNDSLNGPTLWDTDLGVNDPGDVYSDSGDNQDYLLAYHDGLIALAGQPGTSAAGLVALLEEASGRLLWRQTVAVPGASTGGGLVVPTFTADGSVLIQTAVEDEQVRPAKTADLSLFDSTNGDLKWSRPGLIAGANVYTVGSGAFAPDVENFPEVVVDNLDGSFSLLVPRDRAVGSPVDAPACPTGMTPISWTQYAGGAILLCQSGPTFAVVYPSHPEWKATQLNFTAGGSEVVFSNGTRIRVTLGGAAVYIDSSGNSTSQPATKNWNNITGDDTLTVPHDLRACPVGSWPLSLSTYDGGWLLVCGMSADQPTAMFYAADGAVNQVDAVSVRNGGYCGTGDIGEVCAYRAPALVSHTKDGTTTQHSVTQNYFDGHGRGGAGVGSGSYGVDTPEQNGKDQVRYLTQILQKSAAGRANLDAAVDQVRHCTDVPAAVSAMNGVVANRQELLDALESTPVDAVPDGAALIAKLRSALQLSHDSDLVWVQWAQAQAGNGCSTGESDPLYQQVTTQHQQVAAAKDDFLRSWNSVIVPTYAAPSFKTAQI